VLGEGNGLDTFTVDKKSAVKICSQYRRHAAVHVPRGQQL
jgi:hypothetical protein